MPGLRFYWDVSFIKSLGVDVSTQDAKETFPILTETPEEIVERGLHRLRGQYARLLEEHKEEK